MNNSGHTFNYGTVVAGDNSRQHNGNVYGGVTNNYQTYGTKAPFPGSRTSATGQSTGDYTVGWICALAVPEWQASRMLFDKVHDDMKVLGTRHQYVFGEMNGHYVVMGCLPAGQMGENAAASAAADMATTFPAIKIGLLVGIGGGVPSEDHDVRLGDVVVSQPDMTNRNGGVIQYDFGKAIQGQGFVRTGVLNMPPTTLLSGLAKVQAQLPEQSKFPDYLKSFEKYKAQLPKYCTQPPDDRLFEASFVHPTGKRDCRDCNNEVPRVPRPAGALPEIHYGAIASGNQVMKDAERRDELAEPDDILCFEMEAAGLMNQFPCIVVRGICDYCDSHKNKAWQPWAAAVAAAWAKELLRNISPSDVGGEQSVGGAVP